MFHHLCYDKFNPQSRQPFYQLVFISKKLQISGPQPGIIMHMDTDGVTSSFLGLTHVSWGMSDKFDFGVGLGEVGECQ